MRGVEQPLTVTGATVSFLKASQRTQAIAPGDLCFLKCDYTVKLSAFGITHKDVPDKVSDDIRLAQLLRMTTDAEAANATH